MPCEKEMCTSAQSQIVSCREGTHKKLTPHLLTHPKPTLLSILCLLRLLFPRARGVHGGASGPGGKAPCRSAPPCEVGCSPCLKERNLSLSHPVLTTLRDGHSSLRVEAAIASRSQRGGLRKATSLGLRRAHVVLFPADEGLLT